VFYGAVLPADDERFLPNLILHEIEAWVLADCNGLGQLMGDAGPAAELERIVQSGPGPELVNDGADAAPSKRILDRQHATSV
jgi:hypothetical protein